jgi:hypothetical protein
MEPLQALLYGLSTLIGGLSGVQISMSLINRQPVMAVLGVVGLLSFWAYIVVAMLWWTR